MSMQIEDYEGNALAENGDRIKAQDLAAHPLLVYVIDEVGPLKTKHSKSPEGEMGLLLDVLDLTDNTKYLSVLWMNKQVVDNLTKYIGKAVAIVMNWKHSQSGNDYLNLEKLEGEWDAYARKCVAADPNMFVNARVEREMKTYEELRGSKVSPSATVPMNNTAATPPVQAGPPATPPAASAPPSAPPAAPPSAPPAAPSAPPSSPPAAAPSAPPAAPPAASAPPSTPPAAPAAPPAAPPTPPSAPPAPPAGTNVAPAAAPGDDMPF